MRLNWSEKQLSQYQNRQAKYPAKKQARKQTKAAVTAPLERSDALVFVELPWLVPMSNEWSRMHFAARKRAMVQIAQAVFVGMPKDRSVFPLDKARVRITRHSSVQPDPDALNFVKPALDALQVASKRHPYGIGVIVDDSADHLFYEVRWVRAQRSAGRTLIEVWQG